MTDLETLARDLREAMHRHDGFPEKEIKEWREYPVLPWWLAVARHVQQLQREAWIAGRDAAIKATKQEWLGVIANPVEAAYNSAIHDCINRIRTLEPPTQETDA